MLGNFLQYGLILQALALTHFVRRRPEGFWIFVIVMGGGLGALIYILVEVIPDVVLLRGAMQVFPRRKRIRYLEAAVLDNPSVGTTKSWRSYLTIASSRSAPASMRHPPEPTRRPLLSPGPAAMALGDHRGRRSSADRQIDPRA